MNEYYKTVWDLLTLSYPVRMRIIIDLNLLENNDNGLTDSELVSRVFWRAKKLGQLHQLNAAIQTAITAKRTAKGQNNE